MAKTKYHHGDLKQELMRAALEAIEARGQVSFNLREIAKACGVSVAALYRHFASKNKLLIALAQKGFEDLNASFQSEFQSVAHSAQDATVLLGMRYIHFALENEGLFRIMFGRELCQLPEFSEIEAQAGESLLLLQKAMGQPASEGLCQEPLSLEVLSAWSCVHGLATLWIEQNLNMSQEVFLEMAQAVLQSLEMGKTDA